MGEDPSNTDTMAEGSNTKETSLKEDDTQKNGVEKNREAEVAEETEQMKETLEKLKQELAEKEELVKEYRERIQRLQADFENYKKRQKKERRNNKNMVENDLMLEFIPIYDNMDRAFQSFKHNNDEESFIEGMERIYAQFTDLLDKKEIRPIDAEGEQFDPQKHEALMKTESVDHEHNEVIETFERGYYRGEEVLRPSKVKVNIRTNGNKEDEENPGGD